MNARHDVNVVWVWVSLFYILSFTKKPKIDAPSASKNAYVCIACTHAPTEPLQTQSALHTLALTWWFIVVVNGCERRLRRSVRVHCRVILDKFMCTHALRLKLRLSPPIILRIRWDTPTCLFSHCHFYIIYVLSQWNAITTSYVATSVYCEECILKLMYYIIV